MSVEYRTDQLSTGQHSGGWVEIKDGRDPHVP